MTTINTTDDFIRLLQENEEFLAAARRVIYTQDLMELPARFREYTLKTDGRLEVIEEDIRVLKEDVRVLKEDVKVLKEDVSAVKDDTGMLLGYALEQKMHSRLRQRIATKLRVRKARAIWTARIGAQPTGRAEAFENMVDSASDDGTITDEEAGRLLDTDMVMTAIGVQDDTGVLIAMEASGGIRTTDIERARESASILQRLYGADAIPVVYGYSVADQQVKEALADPENDLPEVHIILEPDRT